ncbi:hypothetical protein WA1_50400 [Scytonema hofmannii PCC 7110]|uniref:Uncharacterized protein n=1 Tax=Scytonema hofmannii PCC 7110 TaxID=128403 RepID=A0A139WRB0_9CYAN|nr:hypothetical protein [Scytonema hofmannii]KYC34937.1 hypothetical protein WA1_50400 [Scytonema hofmannii PCC 7110]
MKFKHSLTVQMTPNTLLSSHGSSALKTCSFIENGESCSLSFNAACIKKLDEFIEILINMRNDLATQRNLEIQRESQSLKSTDYSKTSNGTYAMTGL